MCIVGNRLEQPATDLTRISAICRELQQRVESVLRQRLSAREQVHSEQIPIGFTAWASYLAWLDWNTWYTGAAARMLDDNDPYVRIAALDTLRANTFRY